MSTRCLAIALPCLMTLAVGCQGDPYFSEYTRGEVQPQEIVGRYRGGPPGSEAYLDLLADGTLAAEDFLLIDAPISPDEPLRPGEGTWRLARHPQGWMTVEVNIACCDTGGAGNFYTAQLRGQSPPYLLHFILGDPDEGRALIFQRTGDVPE